MFTRFSFVAGVMALGMVFAPSLSAQAPLSGPSCTLGTGCGHQLLANVPQLVNLTLENGATTIPTIGTAEFDAPQLFNGPQFETRANILHTVLIRSMAATFDTGKQASDVEFGSVLNAVGCSGASFTPLSTTATDVVDLGRGRSPMQRLCFRITWDYETDGPGNYALPLELTVTAQ